MIHRILCARAVAATTVAVLLAGAAQVAAQDDGQATARGDAADGRALYLRHCASCHGDVGEGDGPLSEVMPVPNLRSLSARAGGEFPRDAVLRYIDGRDPPAAHGDRLMPVWGDTFADGGEDAARARIAAIADFVARLQN